MERKTFSYWLSQWECWVSKVVKLSSNEWGTKRTLKQKEKIMSPSASCYKKELLFSMKIDDVFMTLHSNKDVCICTKLFFLNAAKWKNFFSVHVTVIFVNWRFNCSQLCSPYLENIYKRKGRRQSKGEKKFYALWEKIHVQH